MKEHQCHNIKNFYPIEDDWEGKNFIGIDFDWNYDKWTMQLSMYDYIQKVWLKFAHSHLNA